MSDRPDRPAAPFWAAVAQDTPTGAAFYRRLGDRGKAIVGAICRWRGGIGGDLDRIRYGDFIGEAVDAVPVCAPLLLDLELAQGAEFKVVVQALGAVFEGRVVGDEQRVWQAVIRVSSSASAPITRVPQKGQWTGV